MDQHMVVGSNESDYWNLIVNEIERNQSHGDDQDQNVDQYQPEDADLFQNAAQHQTANPN
jgi:hypothetical protein